MKSFLKEDLRLLWVALQNPATTLFTLAGSLWAWAYLGGSLGSGLAGTPEAFWVLAVLAGLLAVVAMADDATQLLPLLPVMLIALMGVAFNPFSTLWWAPWAGLLLAGLGMWGLGSLTGALTGKAALGGGDIWLAAALGAWLTPIGLLPWLSAVAGLGLLVVLYRKIFGQQGRFAFAPLLCAAGWLALLHGHFYYAVVLP